MPSGLSACPPGGSGTISVNVDLDAFSRVTFEVQTSADNVPFEQAVLNALATLPAGFTDVNPVNNFALDSDLIFVFIIFKDGLEAI